jgi:hypothetical protein
MRACICYLLFWGLTTVKRCATVVFSRATQRAKPAKPKGANRMQNRHFSAKTRTQLSRKGIRIVNLVYMPGEGDMPFATGETGYGLDNNGEYQIRSYGEVIALAK